MVSMVSPQRWERREVSTPVRGLPARFPAFAIAILGSTMLAATLAAAVPLSRVRHVASVVTGSLAGDGGSAILVFAVLVGLVGLVSWCALGPEDPNSWRVRAAVPAGARIGDLVRVSAGPGILVDDEVDAAPREVYTPPHATTIPVPVRLPYQVTDAVLASGVPAVTPVLLHDSTGLPPMAFPGGSEA